MGIGARATNRAGRRGLGRGWPLIPAFLVATLGLTPIGGVLPAGVVALGDPMIAAAGDIACDPTNANFLGGDGSASTCRAKATSDLLVNGGYSAVLSLGDNQYYCGGYSAFVQSYDLSWGRVKSVSHPVVGNHEYLTSGGTGCDPSNTAAAGYFQYFGAAAGEPGHGFYSYDIGAWHLIALNSNCGDAGGCSSGTPQYTWLAADLAAHTNACTLAYWHIPLFSSGGRAAANMRSLWTLLYDNNADVVLSGHDHIYERFAPQTSAGVLDNARGLRSFIVGTGGANHTSIATVVANSEVRDASTYGILQLTLHATSYDWSFIPEAGKTFTDSGTTQCHGGGSSSSDTTAPSVPQGLATTPTNAPSVSLAWNASTDDVGVTGYGVYRDGTFLNVTSSRSYVDSTVTAGSSYQYAVDARDAAGNISAESASVGATVPASDTTAPSVPQGLAATPTNAAAVSLAWNASTDNVGVSGYGVYRDGALLNVTTTRSYVDSTVTAGGSYQYAVDARDAAGNISAKSASVGATVPASGILTFAPIADAYVRQDKGTMNFGTSAIQIDAKPAERGLLRFTVTGVGTSGIATAKLRIYCTNPSSVGGSVRTVSGSWSESTVTWNTAPTFGPTSISSRGAVSNGQWYEFDVKPIITGNGTFDLGMVSSSSDGVTYVSREGTASQRPQLVVTLNP